MNCRFCKRPLHIEFIDLVNAPPSNSFLMKEDLNRPETFYPLKLFVCENCFLVQVDEYKRSNDIFNEQYAYFSSVSSSWLAHAKAYVEKVSRRLALSGTSFVVEIASNDGYLLQYFKERGIPCLGIEPAKNTAEAARRKGIEVVTDFFGDRLSKELKQRQVFPDLIVGNNVLAHVPDINDFVCGIKQLLNPTGVVTMEFPHLMQLVAGNQFDTIYHEHFSYLSLMTAHRIFEAHGLLIFDVEELPTHGGSLRIYARHSENASPPVSPSVIAIINREQAAGVQKLSYYRNFQARADKVKDDLVSFLIAQKRAGKRVVGYGAAAKGNTLLNYAGVHADLLRFVCDAAPSKQGKFLPGSQIPVLPPAAIAELRPDYILILPWNIAAEIRTQLSFVRDWGGRFVVAVPELKELA